MCTVTFIARKNGFLLGMNRDEKLTRVQSQPPSFQKINARRALFPSEPSGGTWIGVNDSGVAFALINWYSVPCQDKNPMVSRGEVVRSLLAAHSLAQAQEMITGLPLASINPFRVIGFFPDSRQIVEWQWNLKQLEYKKHSWHMQQWVSSGFDEPTAQRIRAKTFRQAMTQKSAGTSAWLRRLHGSHSPLCGPFSTCMHRDDAATVSYSEIQVHPATATMTHQASPLCQKPLRPSVHELVLMSAKTM